jgi:AraC-like DNA-binding protein
VRGWPRWSPPSVCPNGPGDEQDEALAAGAAAHAGFADQSHMTRQLKRTYGPTPARWTFRVAASRGYSSMAPPIRRRCRRKEYDGSAARRAR